MTPWQRRQPPLTSAAPRQSGRAAAACRAHAAAAPGRTCLGRACRCHRGMCHARACRPLACCRRTSWDVGDRDKGPETGPPKQQAPEAAAHGEDGHKDGRAGAAARSRDQLPQIVQEHQARAHACQWAKSRQVVSTWCALGSPEAASGRHRACRHVGACHCCLTCTPLGPHEGMSRTVWPYFGAPTLLVATHPLRRRRKAARSRYCPGTARATAPDRAARTPPNAGLLHPHPLVCVPAPPAQPGMSGCTCPLSTRAPCSQRTQQP